MKAGAIAWPLNPYTPTPTFRPHPRAADADESSHNFPTLCPRNPCLLARIIEFLSKSKLGDHIKIPPAPNSDDYKMTKLN